MARKRKLLTKKQKKKIIYTAIGLAMSGAIWTGQRYGFIEQATTSTVNVAKESQPGLYKVIKFDDGDTITVKMSGKEERVRFIGVDTPETKDPRVPVMCYGKAASEFTKNLIGNNNVRMEADPTNTNRDRYNRLLRYVYLPDGTLVNAEIIKQGYGFAYVLFPFEKMEEFKQHEKDAMNSNRGLWDNCDIKQSGQKKTTNFINN